MVELKLFLLCMFVILVAMVIHYNQKHERSHDQDQDQDQQSTANTTKHIHHVVILGVLSHRSHFAQRNIIRNGLWKYLPQSNFTYTWKFLVAKEPCRVPYEDRLDVYECQPYAFVAPSAERHFFHASIGNEHDVGIPGSPFVPSGPVGFDFVTNDNISVSHLGVYDHGGNGFKRHLKVTLYETHTQNVIMIRTFLPFGARGSLVHDLFVYKDGDSMILPKGFHGSIVVEGSTSQDPLLETSEHCRIDDGGGLITYRPGYRFGYADGEFPQFLKHGDSLCPFLGPSFVYSFHGNSRYNVSERSGRYEDMDRSNARDVELLEEEQTQHNDLLFVDMVEYYRNLPRKMLHFYKWLNNMSFDFAMKTDDDCFINITEITTYIQTGLQQRQRVWVGNFRTNWQVNRIGKWQDLDYSSLTYPPFPCGSGYLVSQDLVAWIAKNHDDLKCYQGEDVSIGIWLAAVNAVRIHDSRFQCTLHDLRTAGVFSIPDNSLSELQLLYEN